jgi:hypothetical protein
MKERRMYVRYDTDAKIYFLVKYNVKTKIKYKILDNLKLWAKKYAAVSRDVSAEGIDFSANKKLKKGDILYLEVYLPRHKKPIPMTGEVRWSHRRSGKRKGRYKFDSGVRLLTVEDKIVSRSIYFDEKNSVYWSAVLDAVFGSFSRLFKKRLPKRK